MEHSMARIDIFMALDRVTANIPLVSIEDSSEAASIYPVNACELGGPADKLTNSRCA